MEPSSKPDSAVGDTITSRCSTGCDLSAGIWAPGGLICRVKILTLLALIAFLAVGSVLGWF